MVRVMYINMPIDDEGDQDDGDLGFSRWCG